MVENKRMPYIDFAKGFAIFLVLWGHVIQYFSYSPLYRVDFFQDSVFQAIYSFHMPLFMLISGFVFYWSYMNRRPWELIIRRIKSLIFPMLVWGTITFLLNSKNIDLNDIFSIVNGIYNEIINIWFLYALLVCSILLIIIETVFKGCWKIVGYILAFLITCTVQNGHLVGFMMPYFVLGFMYNKYKKNIAPVNFINIFGGGLVVSYVILLTAYDSKHFIYTSGIIPILSQHGFWNQVFIDIYRYLIGLVGSISILWLLFIIYQKFEKTSFASFFILLGKHSLQIYLVQKILLERFIANLWHRYCCMLGYNIFNGVQNFFDLFISPILAILIAILIVIILKSLSKIPYANRILFFR